MGDSQAAGRLMMNDTKHHDLSLLARQITKAEHELIERRTGQGDDEDGIAVLFTGNWHDAIPRQLTLNNVLSPVEKITWQAIRLSITDPARPGATPRRDELASMINCSAPTVTTSRMMLRACRWMTFCKSVRKQGRFVGDIYLFNDEPLSLASTLTFDMSYIDFLKSLTQNSNKRLRTVSANTLAEIDALMDIEVPSEIDKFTARLNTSIFGFTSSAGESHHSKIFAAVDNDSHLKNVTQKTNIPTASWLENNEITQTLLENQLSMLNHSKNFAVENIHQSKILSSEINFFTSSRSSNNNYINNKYINAPAREVLPAQPEKIARMDNPNPNPSMDQEKTFTLAIEKFPQLASNTVKTYVIALFNAKESMIPVIHRIISKLPEPLQTDVLLQLVGRRAADYHGWTENRLINAIAFTKALANRALNDEFFPDEWALGLKTAIASGVAPFFFDSPEQIRKHRYYQGLDDDETIE